MVLLSHCRGLFQAKIEKQSFKGSHGDMMIELFVAGSTKPQSYELLIFVAYLFLRALRKGTSSLAGPTTWDPPNLAASSGEPGHRKCHDADFRDQLQRKPLRQYDFRSRRDRWGARGVGSWMHFTTNCPFRESQKYGIPSSVHTWHLSYPKKKVHHVI